MAHERLRFNIILKDRNEDNENRTSNTSYDPIYSDKKYNTHYGIYANFTGDKLGTDFRVDQLHVRLQNYDGEVSIGLTKILGIDTSGTIDGTNEYFVDGFSTGRHIKIYLLLQGLSNKFEDTYGAPEENNDSFILHQGDFLEVITLFEPVKNQYSAVEETYAEARSNNCLFADSEFLYRDGEEIIVLDSTPETIEAINHLKNNGLGDVEISQSGQIVTGAGGHGSSRTCKMKVSDIYVL